MFGSAKYIQSGFTISFPRIPQMRRKANDLEDILNNIFPGNYGAPQVIPVPDDLDPEVPRLIFTSKNGFSQIIVSQISIALNVTYSPDWQTDISKGKQYIKERVPLLYSLFKAFGDESIYFSGITIRVRLEVNASDSTLYDIFSSKVAEDRLGINKDQFYDFNLKLTKVIDSKFFSNITVNNYRTWKNIDSQQAIPKLSKNNTSERGIEISGDFNDRYSYNEDKDYFSKQNDADTIIDNGFFEIEKLLNIIRDSK